MREADNEPRTNLTWKPAQGCANSTRLRHASPRSNTNANAPAEHDFAEPLHVCRTYRKLRQRGWHGFVPPASARADADDAAPAERLWQESERITARVRLPRDPVHHKEHEEHQGRTKAQRATRRAIGKVLTRRRRVTERDGPLVLFVSFVVKAIRRLLRSFRNSYASWNGNSRFQQRTFMAARTAYRRRSALWPATWRSWPIPTDQPTAR